MKLKEILLPEIVIEIDGLDIPSTQILEFFDIISLYDSISFLETEENLMNFLLVNNIIQKDTTYKTFVNFSSINLKYTYGKNYKKFREEFYDLWLKMDRKQLSRERKLKELSNESI